MKALVTGGRGFIGYNLVEELLKNNWEVSVIDNSSTSHFGLPAKVEEYNLCLVKDHYECLDVIGGFKADVIFHQAAWPKVSLSVDKPYETSQNNILSILNVLEAVRLSKLDTKVIFASSSSVYGSDSKDPISENQALCPKSPYALQKAQGEEWCRMYSKMYGLDTCCLRYFNVFGPYSMMGSSYSAVLAAWLYSHCVNPNVKAFLEGDGLQTRDFCYIDNIVQANILAAINKNKFSGEAFNVAQGESHSLLEVLDIINELDVDAPKLKPEKRPERVGDVRHTLADISKAKDILGYKPDINFGLQIFKMAEWYTNNYNKSI